jgi:glycosyltransferase involved in cell wall biosynthesis
MPASLVSIVITAHNYAEYLARALNSALNQTYERIEVIVLNDGSTDHTAVVLEGYKGISNLKIIHLPGVGLAKAANYGVLESTGDYVVRLDADDWFDENLAVILANYLDLNPDIGMVFSDYNEVDIDGELIRTVKRARVNDEVRLLDRPCLAAGAMFRRRCYDSIGGYNEQHRYQEDYDFWINFIDCFEVSNVALPLLNYRQHGSSMSRNWDGRMQARRAIKRDFVESKRRKDGKNTLGVIPARADYLNGMKFPLLCLGQKTLLQIAIEKLSAAEKIHRVIVSTEDREIAEHARDAGAEVPILRSPATTTPAVSAIDAMCELVGWLDENEKYRPDMVAVHYPHSPFLQSCHLNEAIDSMLIYKTTAVIAVVQDLTYHWRIGANGLEPVGYMHRVVRQDKELVFKETGGMYLLRSEALTERSGSLWESVGHIELSSTEAFRIYGAWEYKVAQNLIFRNDV